MAKDEIFSESAFSAETITCNKTKGEFEKSYLAKCKKTNILYTGTGGQKAKALPYNPGVCVLHFKNLY